MEIMENNNDLTELVKLLRQVQQLNERELKRIEPVIRQAMSLGIRDLDYPDGITDPLYDIVLSSGVGRELYDEYLVYLESFDPQRAKEYREQDDEYYGVYDDLVGQAAQMAKEYHVGQVDKQGVDYFEGHLTTVGNAGYGWKEKVVGFLHDAAEDTSHTVEEIVGTLKAKSNGVLKDEDAREIYEALDLLNANTASTREEYIARIKDSFIATKVKLNDLEHNMDISRISGPSDKDRERIKRYRKEYRQVLGYLGPVAWEWKEDEI